MTVVLTKQVSVSKKKSSLLVRENTNPTWEGNANLGFYGPKINLGVGFFFTPPQRGCKIQRFFESHGGKILEVFDFHGDFGVKKILRM